MYKAFRLQLGYVESTRFYEIPMTHNAGFTSIGLAVDDLRRVTADWLSQEQTTCCVRPDNRGNFCSNYGSSVQKYSGTPETFWDSLSETDFDGAFDMIGFFEERDWGFYINDGEPVCSVRNVLAYMENQDYLEGTYPDGTEFDTVH